MGQAHKRKALRLVKNRERVATSLAPIVADYSLETVEGMRAIVWSLPDRNGYAFIPDEGEAIARKRARDYVKQALLDGAHFDVTLARAHARELVALEAEQGRFEAWTRSLGCGPETGVAWAWRESGGFGEWTELGPGWPGQLAQEWPGDSRAPMGRSLARRGRLILAALEDQPDKCEACNGSGLCTLSMLSRPHAKDHSCLRCNGSGHNLRGFLPPVEWPSVVRRKVADSAHYSHGPGSWASELAHEMLPDLSPSMMRPTRVVARGEHRGIEGSMTSNGREVGGFGPYRWCPESNGVRFSETHGYSRLLSFAPRWRRGEIKHAEQRRERRHDRATLYAASLGGVVRKPGESVAELRARLSELYDFEQARAASSREPEYYEPDWARVDLSERRKLRTLDEWQRRVFAPHNDAPGAPLRPPVTTKIETWIHGAPLPPPDFGAARKHGDACVALPFHYLPHARAIEVVVREAPPDLFALLPEQCSACSSMKIERWRVTTLRYGVRVAANPFAMS